MNPNDNNPTSPVGSDGGTTGSSSVPSPLDFTSPSSLSSTSSLSMSDSLASAQDNLMSAGQAANFGGSSATSLDQLGASDATATMAQPTQPLTPADPVPGSIGSVTSVPPVATSPMDMSSFNSSAATATTPSAAGATTSSMPVMGQGASSTASTGGSSQYYNPFSRTPVTPSAGMGSTSTTAPTSSTNVPPALQPQTEKFSDRLKAPKEKKSGNLLTLAGWLLAALFAASTVVFVVLWQQAENKPPKVIYTPSPEEVVKPISMVSCTQDLGAENSEGLEGLTNHRRDITASFAGGELSTIDLLNVYTFTDNAMAEGSRWYFDDQMNWQNSVGTNFGIEPIETNFEIVENVANYNLSATTDKLVGDYIGIFMVPLNADDTVNTNAEAIQQAYEGAGFVCSVEQ